MHNKTRDHQCHQDTSSGDHKTSVPNFIAIHPLFVEILMSGAKWWTSKLSGPAESMAKNTLMIQDPAEVHSTPNLDKYKVLGRRMYLKKTESEH